LKRYQVFISSTYLDLEQERANVLKSILKMNCIPAGMELFPSADDEQFEYIKQIINESDYYILVIGGKYGSINKEGISYTEKEYDYAVNIGKPILTFVYSNPENLIVNKYEVDAKRRKKLDLFRIKVTKNKLVNFWETSEQLASQVIVSLTDAINRYPQAGWIRSQTNQRSIDDTFLDFISQFQSYLSKDTKIEKQLNDVSQQLNLLKTGFFKVKNRNEIKENKLKIRMLSEQELEALSAEEKQSYIDEMDASIKEEINSDPQGSFLDLALGIFNDVINNENNVNVRDFNYMAGMAIQYSDYSVLTEIAMTLLKVMLILKKNDPECSKIEPGEMENILEKHYYVRLHPLVSLVIELINQERDGKLIINNKLKSKNRDLLFNFIDAAIQHDRTIEKKIYNK
jgi:hypothetical protein